MEKGRAGSPRAGCLPLAELGVLLLCHVSTLSGKSNMFSERAGAFALPPDVEDSTRDVHFRVTPVALPFLAGTSSGANLAIRAVCDGETGIAGLICRYGYYGDLAPRGDLPPMLIVHGEKDMMVPVSDARAFVERVRAVSSRPVSYAELPGAHHDFDMFESIRSAAVSEAVEQFTVRGSTSPT